MQSLSGTYGLRLTAQPALALAPAAAAPARVLLRGERTGRGAARWTLHFSKPAPRGVGLLLVGFVFLGGERVQRRTARRTRLNEGKNEEETCRETKYAHNLIVARDASGSRLLRRRPARGPTLLNCVPGRNREERWIRFRAGDVR